jgi:hypothetical protein
MANFDKITKQLEERQQGLDAVFGTAPAEPPKPSTAPARRARQQVEGSKRSSWKMRAWYVQPETASRLRAYVNRQQESGTSIDASEVVDQAIAAWLDQHAA